LKTNAKPESAIVISSGAIRRVVLTFVLLGLLAVVALFGRQAFQRPPGIADQIDRNAYQSVFLASGQVYFGHATVGDDSITLTDVFYFSLNADASQPQQVGQLVKRGSELYGPREPMLIELRQVLFVENLRDDSQVVAAIKRFKSGEQPAATAAPQATQPPATPTPTTTPKPSASR
jgi:hypothetical protein